MTPLQSENGVLHLYDEPLPSSEDWLERVDNPVETARDGETRETDTKAHIATSVFGRPSNNLVDRYFGEIRQHDLLSLEAERALWRRIERHKARARRTLCLSPVALQTLTRLWNQIKHGEIALQEVMALSTDDEAAGAAMLARLSDTVAQLHDLAAALSRHRTGGETALISAAENNRRRQERARLWHCWVNAWEALPLHPDVYEILRLDLEHKAMGRPHDTRLGAAQRAWLAAQRQLDDATAHMLRANLRLVIYVAMRFRNNGTPLLDLIQEGNLGLMRAIDKFEPHRGVKFATYAHWWIRQAIGRALNNQERTVRLPGHVAERHHKMRAARDQLWRKSGQAPTAQEIGAVLGWTPQDAEQLQTAMQGRVSIDQPLPGSAWTVADLMADPTSQNLNATVERERLQHCLEACLGSLKPREAMILRRRFGFETGQPQTLREIGETLGLSRERVRQIEKATLRRIRESPMMRQLADFVGG